MVAVTILMMVNFLFVSFILFTCRKAQTQTGLSCECVWQASSGTNFAVGSTGCQLDIQAVHWSNPLYRTLFILSVS